MASNKKSAVVVGGAVIGSRLFGLIREQVFAAMFGAGKFLDAYNAAFQIPNLLRDLFAEGALSTAFTTIFTKAWEKDGDTSAWELAQIVISTLILILGTICILGILLSGPLVNLTNYGFHRVPGKFELTVHLTRLLFPFILFVSLAAVVMGILNSRHFFALPASASTVFNIISVVTGVGFAYLLDPQADWRHPHFTERALYGVCLGVLLGGLGQLFMQLPTLWKIGFRFRWKIDFSDPRLRLVLALMLPSVIAGAAVQVNVLVNGMFASYINGARSWLNCAFRLMQFPIGVFGVAIATVTLPAVSRLHALENLEAFGETVEDALRFAFFLTLPASVGLAILAEPLISLIYQHGRFSAHDTHETALALQAFSIGLCGYAGIKVLVPCFYALDQPRTPVRVSLFGIVLNLILNGTLVYGLNLGHVGLALTTGSIALINFSQLLYFLHKRVNCGEAKNWIFFFLRVFVAAAACGSIAAGGASLAKVWINQRFYYLIAIGLTISAAAGAYFVLSRLLQIPESVELFDFLQRKLGRSKNEGSS